MEMFEIEKMWAAAEIEEQKTDFTPLPDGKYTVKIDRCQYTTTKETRLPMFAWCLIVKEGQHSGRYVFHNRVLRDADSVKWAKNEFARVGLRADRMSDLVTMIGEVLDKTVEIQIKNKDHNGKPIQNVFINKIVDTFGMGEDMPAW
jgi:hypothetical protein